jgi:hypothetical protein
MFFVPATVSSVNLKSFPLKSSLLLMMFPDVYCIFYRVAFLTLKCLFVLSGQNCKKANKQQEKIIIPWVENLTN